MNEKPRPKRRHIPIAVKREVSKRQRDVCVCGCGAPIRDWTYGTQREIWRPGIHWDHEPALRLRDVNRAGTDYLPPQNNPKYIDARCSDSHRVKTSGAGKSRKRSLAGTDLGKIVRERGRARAAAAKRLKRVSKATRSPKTVTEAVAGSQSKSGVWVSRKIQSAPFPKVHRPMRRSK